MKIGIDKIIIPPYRNRRDGDDGALALLAASIRDVGLLHPPVVSPDYQLIAGGRRLAAIRRLGWTEVEVTVARNLTDALACLTAERDENECRLDLLPRRNGAGSGRATARGDDARRTRTAKNPNVPSCRRRDGPNRESRSGLQKGGLVITCRRQTLSPLPRLRSREGGPMKVYHGKSGDNWILYCGDCRDVMRDMPDASVDHIITDPPYADETHAGARTLIDFASITFDDLSRTLADCGRIVRRWVVGTMDWRHVAKLEATPPLGLRFVRFGVWDKPNGAPQFTGDRPAQGWEAVGILHKEGGKLRWNGGGHRAVWTVNKVNSDHPTGKPVGLLRSMIVQFTDPGETIFDPFCGSGTTGVAALRMGRRFVGVELNPDYCEIAAKRLEAEANSMPLFGEANTP